METEHQTFNKVLLFISSGIRAVSASNIIVFVIVITIRNHKSIMGLIRKILFY